MAIEVKISLFEDLINLLKEIEHWNKTKNKRNFVNHMHVFLF